MSNSINLSKLLKIIVLNFGDSFVNELKPVVDEFKKQQSGKDTALKEKSYESLLNSILAEDSLVTAGKKKTSLSDEDKENLEVIIDLWHDTNRVRNRLGIDYKLKYEVIPSSDEIDLDNIGDLIFATNIALQPWFPKEYKLAAVIKRYILTKSEDDVSAIADLLKIRNQSNNLKVLLHSLLVLNSYSQEGVGRIREDILGAMDFEKDFQVTED